MWGITQTLEVGKKIAISAGDEIVLKTGSATITMQKNGDITIEGKQITIKGSGDVIIKGSKNPSKLSPLSRSFRQGSARGVRPRSASDRYLREADLGEAKLFVCFGSTPVLMIEVC